MRDGLLIWAFPKSTIGGYLNTIIRRNSLLKDRKGEGMQTIVFLGSNKSGTSREALKASTQMGYCTVLLTDRKKIHRQRGEFPEVHKLIYREILNEETIYPVLRDLEDNQQQVAAVISFVDPFVSLAARISSRLGLASLSEDALAIMEDKALIREHLKDLPATPFYTIFPYNQPIDNWVKEYQTFLPMIIKSPVSNGSKDVLLAETSVQLRDGLQYLLKRFPSKDLLAEEYLIGKQYLIEVVAANGETNIVAIIEQEISKQERFIVTGYLYPVLLQSHHYETLEYTVIQIINSLGLINGTCHLEMRHTENGWKLIEINPRMSGGAMNRIILEGTGINLVKETIKLYLGEKPELEKTEKNYIYAKFITINTAGKLVKVTGRNRASAYPGIKEVFVKPRKGAFLTKPYSLGNRYAYVIAASDSAEQAKEIAIQAAQEIKFYLEPL